MCVCVVSCDICIELPLLSAQWSCEFNLSTAINLSTAGCCPPVRFVICTWSLTSIYVCDKRAARELSPKYGGLSTFLPFLIEFLLQTPCLSRVLTKSSAALTDGPADPLCPPRLHRLFCQRQRLYRMFGARLVLDMNDLALIWRTNMGGGHFFCDERKQDQGRSNSKKLTNQPI